MRLPNTNNFFNFRPDVRSCWFFYAAAALSFLPALGFYYVGEEAIHPIVSLEMWYRGEWMQQLLYGQSLKHTPLYDWLIILLAKPIGWEHMLAVARTITISATVMTGIVVGWLAHRLYRDGAFAVFTALIYITLEDVFFYRGWLAYVDPLAAFFIFSSIACLWVACFEKRENLLWLGMLALVGAFLTRALTAYAYYFSALVVLVFREENRVFLRRPNTWLPHLVALAVPVFWFVSAGGDLQQSPLVSDILRKFSLENMPVYEKQLLIFPLLTFAHLLPWSLLALYFLFREGAGLMRSQRELMTAWWILGLNYFVYWFSPQSHSRYIVPLYPLFAFVMARLFWSAGDKAKAITLRWLAALLGFKLIFVLAVFPYYQSHYRGENYALAAREVLQRTYGYPLYSNDSSSSGLNVTAYLDILRLPQAPLTFAPPHWDSGFVLNRTADSALGQVAEQYKLGGDNIYLLCRGHACGADGNTDGLTDTRPNLH